MRALRVSKTKNCPKAFPFGQNVRQDRIILSADTASEKYKLLSKKRREYFVYSRAFLQRRWRVVAAGAVLKPSGGDCVELSKEKIPNFAQKNRLRA